MNKDKSYSVLSEKLDYYSADLAELISIDLSTAAFSELAVEVLRTFASFKDMLDSVSENFVALSKNDKKAITLRLNCHKSMIKTFFDKAEERIKNIEVLGELTRKDRPFAVEVLNNLTYYKCYLEEPVESLLNTTRTPNQSQPGEDQ